jgi:hypothetical protein
MNHSDLRPKNDKELLGLKRSIIDENDKHHGKLALPREVK